MVYCDNRLYFRYVFATMHCHPAEWFVFVALPFLVAMPYQAMLKLSTSNFIKIGAFVTAVVLSLLIAGLSCYKLAKSEDTPVFIGLLSSIVSLWMPSPTSVLQIKEKRVLGNDEQ